MRHPKLRAIPTQPDDEADGSLFVFVFAADKKYNEMTK
jgi:hypothetical protein